MVQSAWEVTAQKPGPSSSSCHHTGAFFLRKANHSWGTRSVKALESNRLMSSKVMLLTSISSWGTSDALSVGSDTMSDTLDRTSDLTVCQ